MAFVTAIHLIVCVLLIIIVLLQHGKGADLGATFGGSGNTLFGAAGADNLFTRLTTGLAVVFMTTSIVLASNLTPEKDLSGSIFKNLPNAKPEPVAAASKEESKKENETAANKTAVEKTEDSKEKAQKAVADALVESPIEKKKEESQAKTKAEVEKVLVEKVSTPTTTTKEVKTTPSTTEKEITTEVKEVQPTKADKDTSKNQAPTTK